METRGASSTLVLANNIRAKRDSSNFNDISSAESFKNCIENLAQNFDKFHLNYAGHSGV